MRLTTLPEDYTSSEGGSLADVVPSHVSSFNSEIAAVLELSARPSRTSSANVLSRTSSVGAAEEVEFASSGVSRVSSAGSAWSETSTRSTRLASRAVRNAATNALGAVSWLLENVERERRVHGEAGKCLSGIMVERAASTRAATECLEKVYEWSMQGHRRKRAPIGGKAEYH
jgi:hypothetical protein